MRNLYKIYFGSKQPKKLQNTSAPPFVNFPMNFSPVTLKKELNHFSKNPRSWICKKTQKMRNLYKIYFGSKQPKKLQNTSATPFVKFPMNFRPVSFKKKLSHLSKIHDPGYEKKLKKREIYPNFFLARNNLKSFKIRPQQHL